MPDTFTTQTHRSYGSRIKQVLAGLILGPLLFFASFFVLFWNEGRVNIAEIAERAVDITSIADVSQSVGELVSYTGTVSSEELLGDTYLAEGSYLYVQRAVEMYAWREEERNESQKNFGGSEDVTTTYTYTKEWTRDPEDSSRFAQSVGHENPSLDVVGSTEHVSTATIDSYALDMSRLEMPAGEAVRVTDANVQEADGFTRDGSYLFRGKGSIEAPEVGDIRISYTVLPNPLPRATVFGQLSSDAKAIESYYEGKTSLYRMNKGSREDGIQEMDLQYTMLSWVFRIAGFAMMLIGLSWFMSPISVILDFVPLFGSVGRGISWTVSFILSLVLTTVTILVSMFLHSMLAVLIACSIATIGMIALFVRRRKKAGQVSSVA